MNGWLAGCLLSIPSIHILRLNPKLLPARLSDPFRCPFPTTPFPHIKCILIFPVSTTTTAAATVISHNPPINAVSHAPIEIDGDGVGGADVEVDEPRVLGVAGLFEGRGEESGVPQAPVRGGDGEDGYVAVPGGVVGGGGEVRGLGFEFAHDCWLGGGNASDEEERLELCWGERERKRGEREAKRVEEGRRVGRMGGRW